MKTECDICRRHKCSVEEISTGGISDNTIRFDFLGLKTDFTDSTRKKGVPETADELDRKHKKYITLAKQIFDCRGQEFFRLMKR